MIDKIFRRLLYFDIDCYILFKTELSISTAPQEFNCNKYQVFALTNPTDTEFNMLAEFYKKVRPSKNLEQHVTELKERYDADSTCIVTKYLGSIIGASWVCNVTKAKAPDFSNCLRKHKQNGYLFFDTYVLEEHRGNKLQNRMTDFQKKVALDKCAKTAYTFVGCRNFSSIHNSLKTNDQYKIIYHVTLKIGKFLNLNIYPKWKKEPWISCKNTNAGASAIN